MDGSGGFSLAVWLSLMRCWDFVEFDSDFLGVRSPDSPDARPVYSAWVSGDLPIHTLQ